MRKQYWWKAAFQKPYLEASKEKYSSASGKRETAFILKTLKIKKGSRVLDLACGQGRHTLALARFGMRSVGVDISLPMLYEARKQARLEGIKIPFLRRDIRGYRDSAKYNLALLLGNSFGYFSDQDNNRILSNIASSLKIGGWLVLDLSNTSGMLRYPMISSSTQKIPDGTITTRGLHFDPKTFRLSLQWHIKQNKKNTKFNGVLRLYTPPEINYLLMERGLVVKKIYGSFAREPYTIETKRYLIMAQKIQ